MPRIIVLVPFLLAMFMPAVSQADCYGRCRDANEDSVVGISDAIYIINFVFVGGDYPQPVLACADANGDCNVNVSDAVYIVSYVFLGGPPPGDCCAGGWEGQGGDCCPYPD